MKGRPAGDDHLPPPAHGGASAPRGGADVWARACHPSRGPTVWKCPIPGGAQGPAPLYSILAAVEAVRSTLLELPAPTVVRMALERLAPRRLHDLAFIQLFTDGTGGSRASTTSTSTSTPRASVALPPPLQLQQHPEEHARAVPAWSMVAVGVHRDGSRSLLGTAAAPLPGFVKAPAGGGNDYSEVEDYNELSGGTGHTSFAAEVFAALWVLLWVHELCHALGAHRLRIYLHVDAEVGKAIADGSAGSSAAPRMAAALRGAAIALNAADPRRLHVRHVYSHYLDPGGC